MNPTTLRIFVYDWIVAHGTPPSTFEIGAKFGGTASDAKAALADLKIGKTVLPDARTGEIWMAGPFAAAPTPYRVVGAKASWWANCAWDMLGVAAIVGEDVRIEAVCTDCGDPMPSKVTVNDGVIGDGLVHLLVPARDWYRDIGYT